MLCSQAFFSLRSLHANLIYSAGVESFPLSASQGCFLKGSLKFKNFKKTQTPLFFLACSNSLQKSEAPLRTGFAYDGNFIVSIVNVKVDG